MKLIYILLGICCYSCTSATVDAVATTDSLVIEYNIPGEMPRTVATTSASAIHRVIGFIDNKEITPTECAYKGRVIFYEAGKKLMEARFADAADCRYFTYTLGNELHHTRMNHEAIDFFKSLEEGKNYY
jgi:hypothetical protein